MLVGVMFQRDGERASDDWRWKTMTTMVDACIPSEKRGEVADTLKQELDDIWVSTGTMIFGKVVANTFTLAIGWAVYTFFIQIP